MSEGKIIELIFDESMEMTEIERPKPPPPEFESQGIYYPQA